MSKNSLGRHFERTILRPFFHRLKEACNIPRTARVAPTTLAATPDSTAEQRLQALEQRIQELEALVREDLGLHYLSLYREADTTTRGNER